MALGKIHCSEKQRGGKKRKQKRSKLSNHRSWVSAYANAS